MARVTSVAREAPLRLHERDAASQHDPVPIAHALVVRLLEVAPLDDEGSIVSTARELPGVRAEVRHACTRSIRPGAQHTSRLPDRRSHVLDVDQAVVRDDEVEDAFGEGQSGGVTDNVHAPAGPRHAPRRRESARCRAP